MTYKFYLVTVLGRSLCLSSTRRTGGSEIGCESGTEEGRKDVDDEGRGVHDTPPATLPDRGSGAV